jgi:deazaflavin-dependent oxidoreductase (nitroreductase family)
MTALGRVLEVHQLLYERSDGRVGHHLLGTPTLLLRTTGRRSGATRTNALVYLADDRKYIVVASKGGDDRPPAWLLNLTAEPKVEVQLGRERRQASARVLEKDEPDYERLWRLVNENNGGRYDRYQARTARPIPLVILTPR